jgi:LysM repeat protein
VQPGDTLYSIARASGLSVDQLAAANGLPDPDVLKVGQVLLLDGDRTYMVQQASLDTPASYTVQSGDTLFGIAARYGISVPAIVAWNGLSDPHYIVAGAMLKLRSGGAPEVKETTLRSTAEWAGSPNYWPGRPNGEPIALVIHTMGGTLPGAMGEFANSFSGASAHFGIGLNGRIQQYVDLSDRAWANGVLESGNVWPGPAGISPNDLTISIETEDLGDPEQPVTEAQYEATLKISRLIVSRYPSIRYLLTHRAISPQTRPDDPGPRWVARGQLTALANALGLKLIA